MVNLVRPVAGMRTSPFGMRGGKLHAGVDLAVGQGTPIHAAAAGSVTRAGWNGGYGNYVSISHGAGISTAYAHMMKLPNVKAGQSVTQGQIIGYVGSTGDSSGPHLHFEVRINGNAVDPWPYINGKAVPSGGTAIPGAENVGLTDLDPTGVSETMKIFDKFATMISSSNAWIRIGMLVIGTLLSVFAIRTLTKGN